MTPEESKNWNAAQDGCKRCGTSVAIPHGYEDSESQMCHLCEIKTLIELAAAQEKLLVAYRLGRRPADKTLDQINAAKVLLNW